MTGLFGFQIRRWMLARIPAQPVYLPTSARRSQSWTLVLSACLAIVEECPGQCLPLSKAGIRFAAKFPPCGEELNWPSQTVAVPVCAHEDRASAAIASGAVSIVAAAASPASKAR